MKLKRVGWDRHRTPGALKPAGWRAPLGSRRSATRRLHSNRSRPELSLMRVVVKARHRAHLPFSATSGFHVGPLLSGGAEALTGDNPAVTCALADGPVPL